MSIDLGSYIGESNLRIRFEYRGVRLGDIWAVDNIKVPDGPQDVLLQWFYDENATDPNNELEQIGQDNQNTVSFTPRKIGWNDFEVKTALLLDSNGDPCETINNSETVKVFVFDQYTTDVVAETGECGDTRINLTAVVTGDFQGDVTSEFTTGEFKTLDGYTGAWVITGDGNFSLKNPDGTDSSPDPFTNPNAIFEADNLGDYTFTWELTPTAEDDNGDLIVNSGCPPIVNPADVSLPECTTLDFDGINDYVSIPDVFAEAKSIEMWVFPEASTGTIISGPGFKIDMADLPGVTPNTRWYHIALIDKKLFIDGIDSGNTINATGTGNETLIGAKWNNTTKEPENYFSGWIEELRIWKTSLTTKELRFMMNQRLDLNSKGSGDVSGEVVPNKTVAGSYYTSGGFNLDQDGVEFYNEKWSDLLGYYRLISAVPDPVLNLIPDTYKPVNGNTPDLSLTTVDGHLHNMTTHQQNTSPTPYFDDVTQDGQDWETDDTWARPDVWDPPNSDNIEWNIARINTNINSGNKNITMLGLLSETVDKELTIEPSHPIRITHYLLLDGNMDLQEESQLLQDHGSILANSSKGWAEIDQQGRMSSFNYNYWTSPVSNQGTDNNSGFMLNQVLRDGSNANMDNPPLVNFKDGYFVADGAKTSPITISNDWIWDFRGGDADIYGDWLHLGSDTKEIVGAGYSMKGTTGAAGLGDTQNYVFRGKPNNGNIPTDELYINSGQNYLVGNPYPSAIDANEFIKNNIQNEEVFNGAIYFWDHFGGQTHILAEYIGGYATYSLASNTGVPAIATDERINATGGISDIVPKRYIPVAQGFFINSYDENNPNKYGGTIKFNNNQRIYATENGGSSIFLSPEKTSKTKSSATEDERAKIRLKYNSPKGYHRQILVTADPETSNNFDLGYDAPLIEDNLEDMYWLIKGYPYVIQAVENFDEDQVLPLAIKLKEKGEFSIQIDSTENWTAKKPIYLKDKMLDSIHDISKEAYKTSSEAGEINDRFELVFYKPDPEIVDNPDDLPVIDGLFGISYSTFQNQVKISNPDLLEISKVIIFDMAGKLIQEFKDIPTEIEIVREMRPVRSGVYIVKVFSENAVTNKKIIVK